MARKEKKATQAKVTGKRQQNTPDSKLNGEAAEIQGDRNQWKVTAVNKSMKRGHQTRQHSSQNLSQVNTIGCADEGLWIFSLEDSKKRRYTVNWEDQSCSNQTEDWKTEEHELMVDSGLFWTCLPTLVCTAISHGQFYKR